MVFGSVDARPAMTSEKKIPMESTNPEFMNVARMPEAAPRWLAGTEFMMVVVFGAENSPRTTR